MLIQIDRLLGHASYIPGLSPALPGGRGHRNFVLGFSSDNSGSDPDVAEFDPIISSSDLSSPRAFNTNVMTGSQRALNTSTRAGSSVFARQTNERSGPHAKTLTNKGGEVRELTAEDMRLFEPIAEVDPGMVEAMKDFRVVLDFEFLSRPRSAKQTE